ncbi:hypothetical protein PPACK8108_LOCUS25701 [Phakopsora pachyrhizi]|uniref:Uncharacterized protein n=1 Tax=Phakopsora pachyrhizi TaxID=170000 RepID=A0AAV0BU61_PHAPC|nr:hypothetical protein PPACK8108_LOCUS25701 [Phakopsora pachyrhizi]
MIESVVKMRFENQFIIIRIIAQVIPPQPSLTFCGRGRKYSLFHKQFFSQNSYDWAEESSWHQTQGLFISAGAIHFCYGSNFEILHESPKSSFDLAAIHKPAPPAGVKLLIVFFYNGAGFLWNMFCRCLSIEELAGEDGYPHIWFLSAEKETSAEYEIGAEDCDGYECRLGGLYTKPGSLESSFFFFEIRGRLFLRDGPRVFGVATGRLTRHFFDSFQLRERLQQNMRLGVQTEYWGWNAEDCDGVAVLRRQLERLTRSGFLKKHLQDRHFFDSFHMRERLQQNMRLGVQTEYWGWNAEDCDGVAVLRRSLFFFFEILFGVAAGKMNLTSAEYEIGVQTEYWGWNAEDCNGVTVLRRSLFFFFEILFGVAAGKMNLTSAEYEIGAEDCDGVTVLRRVDLYSSSLRSVLKFLE